MARHRGGYFYFTVSIVNLLAFSAGVAQTWTSPVLPKLKTLDENPLGKVITTSEASLVNALLSIGNTFGPLLAVSASRYGRKITMLLIAIPITIAYVALAFGSNIYVYYIARFVKGLGVGSSLLILQIYLGEVAAKNNRGTFGCLSSVYYGLGALSVYAIGPYVSIKVFSLTCLTPVGLFLIFYAFIPESPIHLVLNGDNVGAEQSLIKLRGATDVKEELSEMVKFCEKKKTGNIRDILKSPALKKSLTICFGLFIFRQLSGMDVILSNMQIIFEAVGQSPISAEQSPIIIGACKIVVTILTSLVVEKSGRKILLIFSATGASLSILTLGIFFYLHEHNYDVSNVNLLPLICMTLFIISCSFGLMPLPWAILGEIFPNNVKSTASSFAASLNYFVAFMVTLIFPYFEDFIGMSGGMIFFGVSSGVCVIFVWLVVPETKGKSLAEVQDMLDKKNDGSN
ncbi:unnamed protein product [Brassicogethes aeneus]|uniref:Facilitated trehalose transporter Tret1-like n=1 Tax=Brassicogethes aeneus TaxID=1431903 RepID=A0A9P0BJQ9_BRAAE|nr:unnamed protein product [Brassicogethes aeneus]